MTTTATALLLLALGAAGEARAQNAPMAIANFDSGKAETVHGLALIVIADEQLGGTSDARLTPTQPGAAGSRGALRISFKTTADFATPFSGVWALLGPEGLAADASAYRGVRFHVRAKEGTFLAGVSQFAKQTALYMTPFEAKPEWTVVELPFEKFQRVLPTGAPLPGGAALVPKDVVSVGFTVSPQMRGQFDLEIDQVELYR